MISLEQYIANCPVLWSGAMAEMYTIAPREWLGGCIMELYSLSIYLKSRTKRVRYIPQAFTQKYNMPDAEEIAAFQNIFNNDLDPTTPLAIIKHIGSHYFVVVLDYTNRRSVTYGRLIGDASQGIVVDDWETWGGPFLWSLLASFHGWEPGNGPVIQQAVNWTQVSIF